MSRNGFGIRFRTGAVTVRGRVSGFYPLLNFLLGGDFGEFVPQGGGSDSPDEFNYAMFSWRRITLAPILVIGGFAFEIYAILKRW